MYHHDKWCIDDACDRRNIANEIEIEVVVERRVDCVRSSGIEQRMAVGRGAHYRLGANIGAGAGPIFDNELLTESLRQPLRHQARHDVGRATGRKADDQTYRPRRIGLRLCDARYG
jgi:hypothetical protein